MTSATHSSILHGSGSVPYVSTTRSYSCARVLHFCTNRPTVSERVTHSRCYKRRMVLSVSDRFWMVACSWATSAPTNGISSKHLHSNDAKPVLWGILLLLAAPRETSSQAPPNMNYISRADLTFLESSALDPRGQQTRGWGIQPHSRENIFR